MYSRALCVTPGAAVSWSARWWLLSWPSGRAPKTAASFCDSSRPRAARAPARSPERERHVLAYRARILRAAISWPLPLCGKGELGPPVIWSALGGRPERTVCAAYRRAAARGVQRLECGQLSPPGWRRDGWQDLGCRQNFKPERRVRAVGGPLCVTLASRERAANRRVETPATVDPSSADPTDSSSPSVPRHTREWATIWSPRW